MRIARVLELVGRVVFSAGVLLLLFAAYELWGTGIAEARSQAQLKKDFASQLAAKPHTTTSSTPPVTHPGETTAPAPPAPPTSAAVPDSAPPPPTGSALAIMRIPSIGVDKAVVEGVSVSDLKKGPGHYPHTPLPGQKGNVAIAGHRTTYGAPFGNIDALKAGDRIFITTRDGEFQYNVESQKIVNPGDGAAVLASTDDSRLTLTTCHPKYSASKRLIVTAKLVGAPIPTPTTAVAQSTTTAPQATTAVAQSTTSALNSTSSVPKTATPSTVAGSSGFEGNDSKGSAEFPAFAWGALATMVYVGMKVAAAKWKRIAAHAIGYPLFLLVLFMFFENFSRLLPSNI